MTIKEMTIIQVILPLNYAHINVHSFVLYFLDDKYYKKHLSKLNNYTFNFPKLNQAFIMSKSKNPRICK